MSWPSNGDVKTREVPGDDSSSTDSQPRCRGGDYLTLAPGANFPLISDMRDNKCWLVLTYQRHRAVSRPASLRFFLSPELTLLAVRGWPGLLEVRTGPPRPLTEAEDLPGSGLPSGAALAAAVVRGVQLGPV